MNDTEIYSVITGDIVKSTLLDTGDFESVRECLHDWVDVAKKWKRGVVKGNVEFFRGDAWQLLLSDASMALRVGVLLRAGLIAQGMADTRLSIGIGRVDSISTKRVSLSTGEAFVLSGHALDEMNQYSNLTIKSPGSTGLLSDWLPVVGQLCDVVVSGWTARQASIITLALNPKDFTHEEMASKVEPEITKQAVTKALDGANWNALRNAIRMFEKTDWKTAIGSRAGKK
ncbi:hypothetical protein Q31b_16670 [Novipirellula aureliae]|uniref:Uncharacterized protein n=1 Tax=Novipirellula aureliae TaxID=2527966 RepID=A0A5C6E8U6_9BACT|nr:hypothetical protein [Novipirellula aureliae]TWU44131.1 hypothetical protein Q31b_16670 [Novipirellula aureliae]